MRALLLLLALLALASPAQAWPRGTGAACPNPNADGSLVTAPNCTLVGTLDGIWSWASSPIVTGNPNYRFNATGGASLIGNEAERNQGGNIYLRFGATPGDQFWWLRTSSSLASLEVASPSASVPAAGFLVKNGGTLLGSYNLFQDALGALASGDTLEVTAAPAGIPIGGAGLWGQNYPISASNVTISFDSGAGLSTGTPGSVYPALVGVNANSVTVSGGEFRYGDYGLQVYRGALNPTFTNVFSHDNQDGFNSGGDNGTITLQNSTIQHNGGTSCGPGGVTPGYCHNIYMSDTNNGVVQPDNGVFNVTNVSSVDTAYNGDPFKMRVATGTLTQVTAGCAQYAASYTGCAMNWPIDIACGGTYTISHAVIERGPNTAALGGNYSLISFAEEWPGDTSNGWNCPPGNVSFSGTITSGSNQITTSAIQYESQCVITDGMAVSGTGLPGPPYLTITNISPTPSGDCSTGGPWTITLISNATGNGSSFTITRNHKLTISNAILIDDGDSSATHPSYVVQCDNSGTSCAATKWNGGASVANSVIVLNSGSYLQCTSGIAAVLGPDVTDGGGNSCYQTRAAAETALAWSGTDAWGNPCCAFPWVPPRP